MKEFSDVALSMGGLIGLAVGVFAILKGWDWFDGRAKRKVDETFVALSAKIGVVEIKAERAADDLAAFKLEAAREYVTHGAQRQLEARIEAGFDALRRDVGEMRAALFDALSETRTARRRPST